MLTTSQFAKTQIHFYDPLNSKLLISSLSGSFRIARVLAPVSAEHDDYELLEQLKVICVNQGLISDIDEIAMLAS